MEIKLTQGKIVLVDSKDFEWLNQWKWTYHKTGYAVRNKHIRLGFKKYKSEFIRMHRLITSCPKDMVVDHINHNTLDNRKENLRICTRKQNQQNMNKTVKKTSSIYKGVYFCKQKNKFHSRIKTTNKYFHLGFYINEIEAGKAYDKKAKELFGEFAKINF